MRWLVITLLLAGCMQPTGSGVVQQAAHAEEPIPDASEELALWTPVIGGLYVFDNADSITIESHHIDAEEYQAKFSALAAAVRTYNRRGKDGYPFRLVAGGEP